MTQVIFIRHLFKENESKIKDDIFNNKKIAFHHNGKKTWEEELEDNKRKKYTACTIFKKLEDCAYNDVLILAEYSYKDKLLIGKLKKGEKVESIKYNLDDTNEEHYYKTLQLDCDSILELDIKTIPTYLAARPILSTCCKPTIPFLTEILPHIYKREKGEIAEIKEVSCKMLHPSAVEQMCEEYLRQYGYNGEQSSKLAYSSCRVGGTMKDYDIVGRDNGGKRVFAQVKSDSKEDYKEIIQNLAELKKNNNIEAIFFCQDNINIKKIAEENNVLYKSIDKIFKKMDPHFIKDLILIGIDEKYEKYFSFNGI